MQTTLKKETPRSKKPANSKIVRYGMKPWWRRRLRFGTCISIYYDDSTLQLATAKCAGLRLTLHDVTKIYIPNDIHTEEARRKFLYNEIGLYTRQHGGRSNRFVLGMGGSKLAFRQLVIPGMRKKELEQAIYWEGQKRIPFELENAYYGHSFIERVISEDRDELSCAFVAIPKREMDVRVELGESLNIRFDAVYHDLEAMGQFLFHLKDFDPGRIYALMNIQRHKSVISFYRGSRLEFMHVSSVGSETLSGSGENPLAHEYFTESLVNEIHNSLDYFAGQFSNTSADIVYIYGDLCYSEELISNLSNHFGFEFRRFPSEELVRVHPNLNNHAEQIPVSLSAVALTMADGDLIDFLPPEKKERRDNIRLLQTAVPVAMILIVFLLAFWSAMKLKTDIYQSQLQSANKQIELFQSSEVYNMYNVIKRQMAADSEFLNNLKAEPSILHLNLKELSRLAPAGIILDLYDLQASGVTNNLIISGKALSSDPPPEIVLAEFIARLESSPFFDKVTLSRHSKRPKGGVFAIDFQLEMEAVL